jgi:hypothetical protein
VRKPEIEIVGLFNADEDYGYSVEQWREVTRGLDAMDIDVTKPVRFAEPAYSEHKPTSRPVGDVLQELAGYFGARARLGDPRPTPKQQAAKAKMLLTTLETAVVRLEDYYDGGETLRQRILVASELRKLIPQLERQKRRQPAATNDGRRRNAFLIHTEFWLALMQLWWAIPAARRRQHKHCREFLMVCSKPLFPAATTATALTRFIERHSRQTKSEMNFVWRGYFL